MAVTSPFNTTAIEGLQNDSALGTNSSHQISNAGVSAPNVGPAPGRQLIFPGQTAATSAANVNDQGIGTFQIPSGTASGGTVVVTNGLVGANSMVFTQLLSDGGHITGLTVTAKTAAASGVAGTFTVTVKTDGTNTSSNADCWYLIIN